jgi:hypothetical protein
MIWLVIRVGLFVGGARRIAWVLKMEGRRMRGSICEEKK